jgi:hypothetical protein
MLVLALEFSRDGCSATPRPELRSPPTAKAIAESSRNNRPTWARTGERSACRQMPITDTTEQRHEELPKGSRLVTRSARAQHDAEGDVTGRNPQRGRSLKTK